ncbi:MAG: hypothetical protein ACLUGJ_11670 [Blautia wexlerae]
MITDYSGSMFEFMLTGRPVFLFAGERCRSIWQKSGNCTLPSRGAALFPGRG